MICQNAQPASHEPLIVRAELPTPDAVIIRHPNGKITIVADVTLTAQRIAQLVDDTHHLDCEPHIALG